MENITPMDPVGQPENQSKPDLSGIRSQESSQNPHDYKDNSAMHFFLYLVSFLSLSFVSFGLGTILFQIINKNFPEIGLSYVPFYFEESIVKYGLSSIIIATPIYLILTFLINKYLFEGKISENSKVRKWTTYITLFIASAVILGDLITLVNSWLSGDLATRFLLKVLVIIAIAGTIFAYYFWDMHKKNMIGTRYMGNKIFGFSALGIIILVFASSFFIIDTPAKARNKRIDSQTTNSAVSYNSSIQSYYNKNDNLPNELEEIEKESMFPRPEQPEDNKISYKKTGTYAYELCANFKLSNKDEKDKSSPYTWEFASADDWAHDAGPVCFKKEVKPKEASIPVVQNPGDSFRAVLPEDAGESVRKIQLSTISLLTSTAVRMANTCHDKGGEIMSGDSSAKVCGAAESSDLWPGVDICGSRASEMKWIVKNGKNDNWDFTIECKNFSDCNGPNNLICNKYGCQVKGTCHLYPGLVK